MVWANFAWRFTTLAQGNLGAPIYGQLARMPVMLALGAVLNRYSFGQGKWISRVHFKTLWVGCVSFTAPRVWPALAKNHVYVLFNRSLCILIGVRFVTDLVVFSLQVLP